MKTVNRPSTTKGAPRNPDPEKQSVEEALCSFFDAVRLAGSKSSMVPSAIPRKINLTAVGEGKAIDSSTPYRSSVEVSKR